MDKGKIYKEENLVNNKIFPGNSSELPDDFFKVVVRVEGFIGAKKIDSPAGIYTVVPIYSEGNI